jgi:hypothetical protein
MNWLEEQLSRGQRPAGDLPPPIGIQIEDEGANDSELFPDELPSPKSADIQLMPLQPVDENEMRPDETLTQYADRLRRAQSPQPNLPIDVLR